MFGQKETCRYVECSMYRQVFYKNVPALFVKISITTGKNMV